MISIDFKSSKNLSPFKSSTRLDICDLVAPKTAPLTETDIYSSWILEQYLRHNITVTHHKNKARHHKNYNSNDISNSFVVDNSEKFSQKQLTLKLKYHDGSERPNTTIFPWNQQRYKERWTSMKVSKSSITSTWQSPANRGTKTNDLKQLVCKDHLVEITWLWLLGWYHLGEIPWLRLFDRDQLAEITWLRSCGREHLVEII